MMAAMSPVVAALKRAAASRGYQLLTKPIRPASLRAFLASVRANGTGG